MSKIKRILALTLCILLAITSLPITQLVFADDDGTTEMSNVEEMGIVSIDKTFDYTDVAAAKADGWTVKANAHADFEIENGAPVVRQVKQTITEDNKKASSAFGTSMQYKLPAGPVAMDVDNRTSVVTLDGKYTGKVKIDVEAQLDLTPTEAYEYTHTYIENNEEKTTTFNVNVGYAQMYIMSDKIAVYWRIRPTYTQAMSHSNESDTDIKDEKGRKNIGGVPKNGLVMSTTVDTVGETIEATTGSGNVAKGSTYAKLYSKADLTYVDTISMSQMIRLDVGSYSKITGIKVTTLEPEFGTATTEMLNKLPAKLDVNDVNSVTTSEFLLPDIAGVVWSSSDDSLISIDGTKATVNRVKGETKEVYVKATFKTDGINYSKEYAMTLAAADNTIKYYDVNGILHEILELKDGEKASDIAAPVIKHYDFIGWFEKDADSAFDFNTAIKDHVTLYAKYEPKTYNVIFMANGNEVATLSGKYNDVVNGEIPDIPEIDGYMPLGWVIGDTNEVFDSSTLITEADMIVNAKYAEITLAKYTVTFVVDDVVYATKTAYDGYTVMLPETPEKQNYTFVCWMLNGAEYDVETPVTSDLTLEAKFDPNSISVKFYMDETMAELYKEGTGYYNMPFGTLPIPEKPLNKFLGWKLENGTDFTAETIVTEPVSVYAVWESSVKVMMDEDITKYKSNDGNAVSFITYDGNRTESYFDGGFVTRFINSSPTNRTIDNFLVGTIKTTDGDYDSVNRTQIYNLKLLGDYEIELVFDAKLSGAYTAEDGTKVNLPYGYYSIGSYTSGYNAILLNRIHNTYIQSYNSKSASTNSFNAYDTDKTGRYTTYKFPNIEDGVIKDANVKIRYNTDEGLAYMTLGDEPYSWGTPSTKVDFINTFGFKIMNCMRVGDYVKIKRVKVVRYSESTDSADYANLQNILGNLPESLVEDPYDAKGTITFPEIKGVKWTSSDEAIVSTTGEITPWYDTVDVTVTATVTSGIYSYEKTYTLTVKGTSTENEEFINETFESEDDLDNWSFVNLDDISIGGYNVDENGLKIHKITEAKEKGKNYETKRYFAFYDLFSEKTNGAYSITETKDHAGVYDVTVDFSSTSTSNLPMNIAVGYRNGNVFYSLGILKITSDKITFNYRESTSTVKSVDLPLVNSGKVTFRIDNIRNELCLFVDGKLCTERYELKSPMGSDARINAVKVELDTNNNYGDSVTIKGIKVTKIDELDLPELTDVVNASEALTIYDITSNPESVSGTINTLPEKVGDYKVTWSVSSNQIDLETREVYHDTTAKKVYLYAEIYDESAEYPFVVRKTFELNVRAAENTKETDEFIINNVGKITNQNHEDIRYDLDLPQVDGVVWTSSNTSIIDNDGIINKNATIIEATPVVITASSNNVSKKYNLVVSPRTALEAVANGTNYVKFNVGDIDNAKVSGDVVTRFTYTKGEKGKVNVVDDKGRVLVSLVSDENGFHFDYLGSDYKKYNLETANIKIITMPDIGKAAIFVNEELVADCVPLKFDTDYISAVESEINVGTITNLMDKYDILQSNIDNFDYFSSVEFGYADENGITLPTTSFTDATVTWTSDDTSVLSNTGKVTTPVAMRIVNLTFKIADNEDDSVFIEKNLEISVDCADDKNFIYNIVPDVDFRDLEYHQSNSTDGNIDTVFRVVDSNVDDFEIVFDLGEEKLFNAIYVIQKSAKMKNFRIYTSNDGNVWKYVASGDMSGGCSKLVRFEKTNSSYIKFVVEKTLETYVDIAELKLFFNGTDFELAENDINNLNIDTTPTGTSINLPTKGINGTLFTWESSDENIIAKDGKITRPSNGTTVKLTVKAIADGQEITKIFDVYVDSKSTSGPSQVGGGSGGSGGGGAGGMASGGAASTPVIGDTEEDTIYSEDVKPSESTTNVYNDVKETDWFYEAVMTLTEKGVVSGDGSGGFKPSDNVTREQFVKMILEAIEVEVKAGTHSFGDVEGGAWYEDYIATAVSNGIVNGVGGGNFGVGTNITRQDMAVLIERVLTYKNIEVAKAEIAPFADASEVADYAKDAVANMKAIGLIQGYNNNYNPKDNLTRAEAATVIASLLEILAK